jgi:hypothetical protein
MAVGEVEPGAPVALTVKNSASVAPRAKRRGFGVDRALSMGRDATTGRSTAGYGGLLN